MQTFDSIRRKMTFYYFESERTTNQKEIQIYRTFIV